MQCTHFNLKAFQQCLKLFMNLFSSVICPNYWTSLSLCSKSRKYTQIYRQLIHVNYIYCGMLNNAYEICNINNLFIRHSKKLVTFWSMEKKSFAEYLKKWRCFKRVEIDINQRISLQNDYDYCGNRYLQKSRHRGAEKVLCKSSVKILTSKMSS